MKRLAKYGLIDIAIRKEKQLLILICERPEQARSLFRFLTNWLGDLRYKIQPDRFEIMLRVHRHGNQVISFTPEHPSYAYTKNFKGSITKFTTGSLLPNGQLAYLKKSTPLEESYADRLVRASTWKDPAFPRNKLNTAPHYPTAKGPDFISDGLKMIGKGLRSIFLGKG